MCVYNIVSYYSLSIYTIYYNKILIGDIYACIIRLLIF